MARKAEAAAAAGDLEAATVLWAAAAEEAAACANVDCLAGYVKRTLPLLLLLLLLGYDYDYCTRRNKCPATTTIATTLTN